MRCKPARTVAHAVGPEASWYRFPSGFIAYSHVCIDLCAEGKW